MNNQIQEGQKCVTTGAAKALLKKLTWDPEEGPNETIARFRAVADEARRAGCYEELEEMERQMWIKAAGGAR